MNLNKRAFFVAFGLLSSTGCLGVAQELSAENAVVNPLPIPKGAFRLAQAPDAAEQWLNDALSKRGFTVVDDYPSPQGKVIVFKGHRSDVTSVQGVVFQGNGGVSSSTLAVGSVFYVLTTPADGGSVVTLTGEPTVNGHPEAPRTSAQISGSEEAEVIRGLVVEAGMAQGTDADAVSVAAVDFDLRNGVNEKCNPEAQAEWATATAAQKKQMYEACH